MLLLDPKRLEELRQRLAARQLREEDFAILPALLASARQLAPWVSEEGTTDECLQALTWGAT